MTTIVVGKCTDTPARRLTPTSASRPSPNSVVGLPPPLLIARLLTKEHPRYDRTPAAETPRRHRTHRERANRGSISTNGCRGRSPGTPRPRRSFRDRCPSGSSFRNRHAVTLAFWPIGASIGFWRTTPGTPAQPSRGGQHQAELVLRLRLPQPGCSDRGRHPLSGSSERS
jgi:hypothetical protein